MGVSRQTINAIEKGDYNPTIRLCRAICRALGEAFGTGMTCIPAQGGFSHEEMTIVYFVVNRFQISRMKDIVHDLDDRAYITISEVADVFKLNQDKLSQKVDNQPLLPRRRK